ncbi:hypothetical protein Tco_1432955, partial [Tanacetum coccineum]
KAAVIEIPATSPPISHVARNRFDELSPEFDEAILKNEWLDYGEMMGKTDDDGVMMVSSGCVQATHAECVIAAMSGVCTPKTKDGENGSGRHDLSSMQGWHATMEDDANHAECVIAAMSGIWYLLILEAFFCLFVSLSKESICINACTK